MRVETGGYEVVETIAVSDTILQEVVKARVANDYLTYRVEIGPGPDHSIIGLTFTPTDRRADVPASKRVPAAGIGPLIGAEPSRIGDFSGAVLVAHDGQEVYARAQGLADRARRIPNTISTSYRMASMGKMFTAVAVLQLNQAGKLDLDATVGSFLRDYANPEFSRTVTVRELFTHTSGAGDFRSRKWVDNIGRFKTATDYFALFGTRPPEFKPGSRFSYAN